MGGDILSLFGMLLAVVLILFLAYWASRWVAGGGLGRFPAGGGGGAAGFRVLGQLNLGRDQRLLLVAFCGQCFLLGVTAQQVTLLKEFPQEQAEEFLRRERESSPQSGFLDVLKETMRKKG